MRSWQSLTSALAALHDPRLRRPSVYEISRRNTTAMGRATSALRFLAALVFAAALGRVPLGSGGSPWWWVVTVPAFAGSALAVVHTHQDLIEAMMRSRLAPLRVIGRELDLHGWQKVNFPAVLETFGPLVLAWTVGAPAGPFTGHPGAQLIATAATLLYSGLGTLHWIVESVFYQFEPTKAWSVAFARLARAVVPALLGTVYGLLLSRNADATGANAGLPWLAAVFLLLYPATVVYERILTSALNEMRPAIVAQRLKDATIVHSSISNPLHYVLLAARERPAADAEPLMIYLRGELRRCLDELDHQHPSATIGEIVDAVRAGLLPDDRHRLAFASPGSPRRLSPMDASLARSILADLCCNALKEVRGGHRPRAVVTAVYEEDVLTLVVSDDGPGFGGGADAASGTTAGAAPGTSLVRLRQLLGQLRGNLTFRPGDVTGTVVTASWSLTPQDGTS
ncbi:hypothetical protein [Streptomyces sp. NPDC001568]|uniref:hypothetical protein n=1 Tax=Streptomyces sp. NPDC001568 TaxID=3364588 RepID=UPI0036791CAA